LRIAFTMESAFAKPVGDVLANFNVNEATGLSDSQVTELRNKHGRNCTSDTLGNPATFLNCLTFGSYS
jgi:Ca2+ transporting ATPase